jgi:hypothetical protein
MPGVVISTAVRTGPSSATVRESSQLFVVGLAERGPVGEAVLVHSLKRVEHRHTYVGLLEQGHLQERLRLKTKTKT